MITIIKAACAMFIGFFAGPAMVYIFNRVPAKWLCDYGETPPQELTDPNVKRIKENPWRWVYAAGFICLAIRLSLADVTPMLVHQQLLSAIDCGQLALAGLIACWLLLFIALADIKYMIIPDQFVLMLAVTSIGYLPFRNGIFDPLIGMAIGGGSMLIVAGLGALMKKELLGFGDVKLCAALGLVLGMRGMIAVLILAVLAAGIYAAVSLAARKLKKNDRFPLGPFICGSAIAYIFVVIW
ncbi:MAG: A24 family peptidase [Bacillota bacterium]|nr:A24 family peptidase [Bacillota bacterium]